MNQYFSVFIAISLILVNVVFSLNIDFKPYLKKSRANLIRLAFLNTNPVRLIGLLNISLTKLSRSSKYE